MRRLLFAGLSLIGFAVLAYVWFFVPLGRRTLHEHALRIASTQPAQELRDDVANAGLWLANHVTDAWKSRYATDAGAP
jgi:hypothetical protein